MRKKKNHAQAGKPAKEKAEKSIPLVWDSMAAAARGLEISLAVIRRAKKEGCTAFKSNRVYTLPLVQWLADHKVKVIGVDYDQALKRAKVEREELKVAQEKGLLVPKEIVKRRYRENLAILFQEIRRRFVASAPPRCDRRPADEIADINEEEIKEMQRDAERRADLG